MTLEKAIKCLKEEYEMACRASFVEDPVAFALYRTWRQADLDRQRKQWRKEGRAVATPIDEQDEESEAETNEQEDEEEEKPSGLYECFHCCARHAVIWDCDYSFEDYGYDGEGIIHACHCTNCGAEITYAVRIDDDKEEEKQG